MGNDQIANVVNAASLFYSGTDKCHSVDQVPVMLSSGQVQLLQDLRITLDIRLQGIELSADQLIDLSPSQVLDIQIKPDAILSLSLAGEDIGTAKFVMIGDKLGLEVLSVNMGESV